ncbi:MAG: hypothetical protein LBM09_01390 [Candidatus Nomurabacteria bacterium]|jgi:hypothetical protein|nr:hypothetical protein [Candidatus Nomurabacteria bacterium]
MHERFSPENHPIDKLNFPDSLLDADHGKLPELSSDIVGEIKKLGFKGLGTVAAVINAENNSFLFLEHNASAKNTSGQYGTLSETSRFLADFQTPEPPMQTFLRGVAEELGANSKKILAQNLHASQTQSWFLNQHAVGGQYDNSYMLAICPVFFIYNEIAQDVINSFQPTKEISSIKFVTPDQLDNLELRSYVRPWYNNLVASGILGKTDLQKVLAPNPLPASDRDISFLS